MKFLFLAQMKYNLVAQMKDWIFEKIGANAMRPY